MYYPMLFAGSDHLTILVFLFCQIVNKGESLSCSQLNCTCHVYANNNNYDLEVDAEMIACYLKTNNIQCLLFAVFYRPPDIGERLLDEFRRFLNKVSGKGIADLIITGDFNFP